MSEWPLFTESNTGIRAKVYEVIIPSELSESEIASFLDDIYHEYSSEEHERVIRLT